MYFMETINADDSFVGIRITSGGRMVAELRGGISLTIYSQHEAYTKRGNAWADAYLAGIVIALNHCTITGQVPVAMVG